MDFIYYNAIKHNLNNLRPIFLLKSFIINNQFSLFSNEL